MREWERRSNESFLDYEERIYKNRTRYGLDWAEVNEILSIDNHPDHTRKMSYGYLRRVEQEKSNTFDRSVMIMSDIHLPFERDDVLEIIAKHSTEINTLVIAGDLLDCKSVSSFPQIKSLTLEQELVYGHKFLKEVRKILNNDQRIILIRGNHEERYQKEICRLHQKDMQKLINPELLDMICSGFTLYEDGKKKMYDKIEGITYIPHWYANLDEKLIVCHPKDFSRVKGKMLENVSMHFMNKGEKFDVVVFGHTHKASTGLVDRAASVFAIENPCMCKNQSYSDVGKLGYAPQAYGYTIVKYSEDEGVDFNNIRVYHLEEEGKGSKYVVNL